MEQVAFGFWLDCANVDAVTAAALLTAPREDFREAYEISTAVNRVANDRPALPEPIVQSPTPARFTPATPATAEAQMSAPAKHVKKAGKMSGKRRCLIVFLIDASREYCAISLLPIVPANAYDVRGCKLPILLENIKMRLITFVVAIITASAPAGAQGWREYEYPNEGFTVAFPAEPKVETTSYQASGGRLVEARVYSVVREGGELKVTVADMSHAEMSEGDVMAYAVLMLSRGGEVKIDIPHSTRRIIGRQASIDGVDGSQTYASVFFHNRRLYQIEGTVPAGGPAADAIRFQQSFDFTDGWRLPDALSNELRAR